ncbi:hypothetical protein DFS33DRAFT_983679 [Desarmillaria ectypa]|nr:hypothetical protein DFS33DRAFT_983679 [Desarmillaria ectypa]
MACQYEKISLTHTRFVAVAITFILAVTHPRVNGTSDECLHVFLQNVTLLSYSAVNPFVWSLFFESCSCVQGTAGAAISIWVISAVRHRKQGYDSLGLKCKRMKTQALPRRSMNALDLVPGVDPFLTSVIKVTFNVRPSSEPELDNFLS